MATEVLEHCTDSKIVLMEIHRVLKKGGSLIFTVPFLWPLHEVPYDHYRFTPFALQSYLSDSGFRKSELQMLSGWDTSLAQVMALWVVRRPGIDPILRRLLRWIFRPIVGLLHKTDSKPNDFGENQMITGLSGIAQK